MSTKREPVRSRNGHITNSRDYKGYEDGSMEGRAEIAAFNAAGGPGYLRSDSDPTKYDAAVAAANAARTKAAVARGGSGGPPRSRSGPDMETGNPAVRAGQQKLRADIEYQKLVAKKLRASKE